MVLNAVLKVYYQKDIHIKCFSIFGNNVQVIINQSLSQSFVFYLIINLILDKKVNWKYTGKHTGGYTLTHKSEVNIIILFLSQYRNIVHIG